MLDAVIVGAGPAGLTALTYLARFHRRAVALSGRGARPRLLLIDRSYNLPGYPEGVPGKAMLASLREQAEQMGGRVLEAAARQIEGKNGAFTIALDDGEPLQARKVILAMGVRDREPDIPGIAEHVGKFLRYCPICDGFEHSGKRMGIVGSGPSVARHALFLRTFSDHVTVFLHGESPETLGQYAETLRQRGIAVHAPRVVEVLPEGDTEGPHAGRGVRLEDGSEHPLSVLYGALGCDVNLQPAQPLGLEVDEEGYVHVDSQQQTSVPGVYAAGDLVSNVNQISVAFGQAAIAAISLHNALGEEEGRFE